MSRFLWLAACLLCLSGPGRCDPPHKVQTVMSFSKELNLSKEQRGQITRALGDLRKQLISCQERNVSLQRGLNSLLRSHAPLPQIRTKFEEIAANEVEAKMVDVSTARKIQEILTPDQFERWKAIQVRNGAPP